MITYTYIVKCPECEDEFFDFFDEAKEFALGCMSKKPIITQTEVNRNDFGECTDHCDLGTVWSWEDMMKETDTEPTVSVFTKDDLKRMVDGKDPEFDDIDNSVDFEIDEVSETPTIERKPIPDGMTIDQLKEAMEENEDTVECAGCEELFPKEECFHKDGIGWLCGDCEDRVVKCVWCNELYDRSECRWEVDFEGWLCGRCEMAIKSRGETLTFREGNYWDFLDEEVSVDKKRTWVCYYNGNDLGTVEADTKEEAYLKMEQTWPEYNYNNEDVQVIPEDEHLTEASLSDIADAANAEFGGDWNSDDLLDFAGIEDDYRRRDTGHNGMTHSEKVKYDYEQEQEKAYKNKLSAWKRYKNSKTEEIDPESLHDLGNEYDGGYPTEKPELSEIDEVSDSHLALCPECGKNAFDTETGICIDCGFN